MIAELAHVEQARRLIRDVIVLRAFRHYERADAKWRELVLLVWSRQGVAVDAADQAS